MFVSMPDDNKLSITIARILKRISYSKAIFSKLYNFTDSKTDCDICDETIAQLESIDDDAEAVGVRVIQTDDEEFIEEYGITEFPAVIYFENEDPSIYDGTYKIDLKK